VSSSSSSVVVPTSNDDFSIGDESEGKWEMRSGKITAVLVEVGVEIVLAYVYGKGINSSYTINEGMKSIFN
jgi:hypothetical protein